MRRSIPRNTEKKVRRRITVAVLTVALAFSTVPTMGVQAANTDQNAEISTDGQSEIDETQTYERVDIYTVKDLQQLAKECHVDAWSTDKEVHLMADLSLSGEELEPISVFNGRFLGEGHTISGFFCEGNGYVTGLFRYIGHQGEIRDLRLEADVSSTDEKEYVGGLVGVNYGTISNCTFSGTVDGKNITGGIAGINESSGLISDSLVLGRITGYYATGGVAGKNHGMILSTRNQAGVNDNTAWVEESDEIGIAWIRSIDGTDSNVQVYSGVDTGGIAGYSDGYIGLCTNLGRVGYEHTGYNIGGIAGRQAGMVDQCTNSGIVNGRKDVGGIVGQMEPYIELNEGDSLRAEVNKLHDLIQKTIQDMQAGQNTVKTETDQLLNYSQQTLDTGKSLADQISNFTDSNIDEVNKISRRADQIMDMVPNVLDQESCLRGHLSDLNGNLKKAIKDLNLEDRVDSEEAQQAKDVLQESNEKLQGSGDELDQYVQQIQDILEDDTKNDTEKQDEIQAILENDEFREVLMQVSTDAYEVLRAIQDLMTIYGPAVDDALQEGLQDLNNASKNGESAIGSLEDMSNAVRVIVNYVNAQEDIVFTRLGEQFDQDKQALHDQLSGMNQCLQKISNASSHYSDVVTKDLLAVNDQINVVFNLLMDQADIRNEEGFYEDVSDEQLEEAGDGWIENCKNKGMVSGDINVGGISGSMAIDEEDPEDSAAGNLDYQTGNRYVTRCVIRGSVNEGYITAKKDGAGGIAGYMKIGAVVDSEGYGGVESIEGDFVGGICGQSLSVIRNCYAISDVSGGKNVGGIAGYADQLTNCYSLARVSASIGRSGAIAGQVSHYEQEEESQRKVAGNYFAGDALYGIDGISYEGVAQSISYEEMLGVEEIPLAFHHLKVTYRTQDQILGYEEVPFGASLDNLTYPDIPKKQGYYGVWPDVSGQIMTGNRVLEVQYMETVSVVQSDALTGQTDNAGEDDTQTEGRPKPYALVESSFTDDAVLYVSTGEEVGSDIKAPEEVQGEYCIYQIWLENTEIEPGQETALRLYNPYGEQVELWRYTEEQGWQQEEIAVRGEYLQSILWGDKGVYCLAQKETKTGRILMLTGSGALAVGMLMFVVCCVKKQCKKEKIHKKESKN